MDGEPTNYPKNAVACKLWSLLESPIEHLLGVEMFDALKKTGSGCWIYSAWEFQTFSASQEQDTFVIVPQYEVPGVGHVDFAIFAPHWSAEPLVIVEADGHDFHERTPEQASEDNRRDRVLQRRGFPVLRFTGTDVLRRSRECAREVAEFAQFECGKKVEQVHEQFERECLASELAYVKEDRDHLDTELQWARMVG